VREEFTAARLFPMESRTKLILFKRDEKKSVLMLEMLFQSVAELMLCREMNEAVANVVSRAGIASALRGLMPFCYCYDFVDYFRHAEL
jgi:hypothetical protein